jgi:hypothetical protein
MIRKHLERHRCEAELEPSREAFKRAYRMASDTAATFVGR